MEICNANCACTNCWFSDAKPQPSHTLPRLLWYTMFDLADPLQGFIRANKEVISAARLHPPPPPPKQNPTLQALPRLCLQQQQQSSRMTEHPPPLLSPPLSQPLLPVAGYLRQPVDCCLRCPADPSQRPVGV